jgi:hypothetical protein
MRDTAINKHHGGPFANDPMRDVSVDALVESIVGDHGQVPQLASHPPNCITEMRQCGFPNA